VSHGVPPALVVSFEEWEEGADLLQDLDNKQIIRFKLWEICCTSIEYLLWQLTFVIISVRYNVQ